MSHEFALNSQWKNIFIMKDEPNNGRCSTVILAILFRTNEEKNNIKDQVFRSYSIITVRKSQEFI